MSIDRIQPNPDQELDIKIFEIERRINPLIQSVVYDLLAEAREGDEKTFVLESMKKRLKAIFKNDDSEDTLELDGWFSEMQSEHFGSLDEFTASLSKGIVKLLAKRFSLQELEERLRDHQMKERGFMELNRLLSYDMQDGQLYLHVATVFVGRSTELMSLFQEGMKELASKLENDSSLRNIKVVYARSSLVRNHRLMRSLGFEVTPGEEDQVQIDKDTIIQRYLK